MRVRIDITVKREGWGIKGRYYSEREEGRGGGEWLGVTVRETKA